MKIKPSYEACKKAYEYILPTVIELCKKEAKQKEETK